MNIMDTIAPQEAFRLWGVSVSNSVVATWIMMAGLLAGVLVIRARVPILLEMLIDFIEGLASGFIHGPTEPYLPFLGTLFLFIAVANVIGIVPWMYTPTRDVNTPVALALVVLVMVFVFGVYAKGILGFVKGFLSPLLPLDLIGYLSRTMSLSLRLFGNIIGSEIVVAVLFNLVPLGVPLIMVAMGTITGLLQAYVFTVLAASYISTMIET